LDFPYFLIKASDYIFIEGYTFKGEQRNIEHPDSTIKKEGMPQTKSPIGLTTFPAKTRLKNTKYLGTPSTLGRQIL